MRRAALVVAATLTLLGVLGPGRSAWAQGSGTPSSPLQVGIKPLDPFVTRSGDAYAGFSIELWDEIARRNGWSSTYVWHDTLAPLLDDIAAAKVDVALAGISITKEREARFDFSYPMFNAGLQVLAGPAHAQSWTSQLRSVLNASVAKYLLVLLLGTVLAGNVVWFVTRRRSEKERSYVHGIGHGMYKAAAVGLAGDFGSADAQRPIGRFFSIVWVMVGICFVSLFTATVTTQLTVQQIKSDIGGVTDLPGKRVVTVKGSTAAQYLTNHQIAFTTVDVIDQAYDALDNGRADAIVFDAPVLQHHANATGGKRETLVGGVFQREDYGIALPTGSTLRKPVNETLLALRADGTYDRLYEHYFGTNT